MSSVDRRKQKKLREQPPLLSVLVAPGWERRFTRNPVIIFYCPSEVGIIRRPFFLFFSSIISYPLFSYKIKERYSYQKRRLFFVVAVVIVVSNTA